MRKSKFTDGTPFFKIKVESFVTRGLFAKILADHYWTISEEFDPKIRRTAVMEILLTSLRLTGIQGIDITAWEGSSEEFVQPHNNAYEAALAWIDKNYPYLNQ